MCVCVSVRTGVYLQLSCFISCPTDTSSSGPCSIADSSSSINSRTFTRWLAETVVVVLEVVLRVSSVSGTEWGRRMSYTTKKNKRDYGRLTQTETEQIAVLQLYRARVLQPDGQLVQQPFARLLLDYAIRLAAGTFPDADRLTSTEIGTTTTTGVASTFA